MTKTCFIYWDPHPVHKIWAKSVNSEFYSFVPFNSKILKSNGILLHVSAFLKALFTLPKADVYLMESPMMITAVYLRSLFSKRKIIAINSDPFLWILPKYNPIIRKPFEFLIKRINGYLSTSEMMDSFAAKTGKKHVISDLFINQDYLNINVNLSSKNACFIGPHLNTNKGVDILVDVFSELPEQEKRNLYLIGNTTPEVEKRIKNKNIHVTGRVSDPGEYLKRCGLYFNLARFEPAGINILEAMAVGIPPIVSNMCGFSSILKKVSPRLVVSLNKKEIIKTVNWLENSGQKKNLGRKAKEIAKRFTKQNSISDFKKKFNLLLS